MIKILAHVSFISAILVYLYGVEDLRNWLKVPFKVDYTHRLTLKTLQIINKLYQRLHVIYIIMNESL